MNRESKLLWELGKLVQEFERLDKQISDKIDSLIEGDFSIIYQVIQAKENIKEFLIEYSDLTPIGYLNEKLKKIRDNKGEYNIDYFSDESQRVFCKELAQKANENLEWLGDVVGSDIQEYINAHYFRRRRSIWPFLSHSIPRNIKRILFDI
jgi:hypothetical protein